MNNKKTEECLIDCGLSKKEASVYISLLELGKTNVSAIAKRSKINRTTVYDILSSLINKKIVHILGKKPKQEFIAEPPEAVLEFFKLNIEERKKSLEKLNDLMPEIKSIYSKKSRPKVMFYEGKDGLMKVYEDTLNSSETILAYASMDDAVAGVLPPRYFPGYWHRRAKKNIYIKAIVPKTKKAEEIRKNDEKEKRETVFVPEDTMYFSPEINIYDNKIMIASWREELGIVIESEEIADAMKKIYKLAWEGAKKIEKENNL